jgi:hypothetical protein
MIPQVFSKHLDVSVDERKRDSQFLLWVRAVGEASVAPPVGRY